MNGAFSTLLGIPCFHSQFAPSTLFVTTCTSNSKRSCIADQNFIYKHLATSTTNFQKFAILLPHCQLLSYMTLSCECHLIQKYPFHSSSIVYFFLEKLTESLYKQEAVGAFKAQREGRCVKECTLYLVLGQDRIKQQLHSVFILDF